MKHEVIVVGGGAAGMMAAGRAAELGCDVLLLEKMGRLGSKLRITGKGRCNITNMEDIESFIGHYGVNGKFLRNCFSRFFNRDLVEFFENRGVRTVVERGKRVFPAANRAGEIVECLHAYLQENKVQIRSGFTVDKILVREHRVYGIRGSGDVIHGDCVILATGGISYPLTGSTGDGYRFAQELGHHVRKPQPSLVPLEVSEDFVKQMQGLSLKNVELTAFADGKRIARLFGEMLFTHFGVSGPIVLTMSGEVVRRLERSRVSMSLNFKPAINKEQLGKRLIREFEKYGKMKYQNVLKHLLPAKAVDVFVRLSEIDPDLPACEVDRAGRRRLTALLTDLRFEVKKARPIAEAIVTDGGVDLSQIDPYTMQSRSIKGLFFCGEVIDIAGDTGGYNLQAAFSTGYVAGESACSTWRNDKCM